MALADKLKQAGRQPTGIPCSVGRLLETLTGDELAAFKTMLGTRQNRGWSASEIYRAVTDEGHYIGLQTINRHRGESCACFKGDL